MGHPLIDIIASSSSHRLSWVNIAGEITIYQICFFHLAPSRSKICFSYFTKYEKHPTILQYRLCTFGSTNSGPSSFERRSSESKCIGSGVFTFTIPYIISHPKYSVTSPSSVPIKRERRSFFESGHDGRRLAGYEAITHVRWHIDIVRILAACWSPLYSFFKANGVNPPDSKNMHTSFCAELLGKKAICHFV
jgi:hypothetical protein